MKLSALKRERLAEVEGRTPPDWDLQDENGTSFYLAFVVRRDTVPDWLDYIQSTEEWRQEAVVKGLSGAGFGAVTNGAKRRAGGLVKPFRGGPSSALHDAYMQRVRRSRDERREEDQRHIDAIRQILLTSVEWCETDQEPRSIEALMDALMSAGEGVEHGDDCTERYRQNSDEDCHRECPKGKLVAVAVKDNQDALSAERWLSIDEEPVSTRALTDAEVEIFFTAQLVDDEAPFLLPESWTYPAGAVATASDGVRSVILSLAKLASDGVSVTRQKELEEGKEQPFSGQSAPLGEEKATPISKGAN